MKELTPRIKWRRIYRLSLSSLLSLFCRFSITIGASFFNKLYNYLSICDASSMELPKEDGHSKVSIHSCPLHNVIFSSSPFCHILLYFVFTGIRPPALSVSIYLILLCGILSMFFFSISLTVCASRLY